MNMNRRKLLIGGGLTLLAAPALVKASSLMDLRGYNMDPKVLAFYNEGWIVSALPTTSFIFPAEGPYSIVRLSETRDEYRTAAITLPFSHHMRALDKLKSYGIQVI